MTTLKISWTAKKDMRRVQVSAVHQTLASLRSRSSAGNNTEHLSFCDLRDYVLWIFPELKAPMCELRIYYIDDDQEQVRITNDVELDEAFRLMRELAVAAGKDAGNAVCKIIVVATVDEEAVEGQRLCSSDHAVGAAVPRETGEMLASQQKKQISDLFVDLGKVVEQWSAHGEHETLKRDLVSLLHEPGCQEALLEIMANAKVRVYYVERSWVKKRVFAFFFYC
uniref:PB1 domain-containing protein n=1 Tax=Hyaloperonospora arabidopsidis (strain Emoy2) TaxID=559515 RepID=M4B4E9_HYAAE